MVRRATAWLRKGADGRRHPPPHGRDGPRPGAAHRSRLGRARRLPALLARARPGTGIPRHEHRSSLVRGTDAGGAPDLASLVSGGAVSTLAWPGGGAPARAGHVPRGSEPGPRVTPGVGELRRPV